MILNDKRNPNGLSKSQVHDLDTALKPDILRIFSLTKDSTLTGERQLLALNILSTVQHYLSYNDELKQDKYDFRITTRDKYTIIVQTNKELSNNMLTVKGLEVSSLLILSTSKVLIAFEEVLGYLKETQPDLNLHGDVYYIVPESAKGEDFALFRFSLGVLKNQYQHIASLGML